MPGPADLPLLSAADIRAAMRIRKVLAQAAQVSGAEADVFGAKARRMAARYRYGQQMMFAGQPVLPQADQVTHHSM